jgi:hypothetical protein
VKDILYQTGLAKRKIEEQERRTALKRRRESRAMERIVRRRLGDFYFHFEIQNL